MSWTVDRRPRVLPHGRTLPAEEFRRRHRVLLVLLWLHVAALPALALGLGLLPVHALLEGAIVVPFALGASLPAIRAHRRLASTLVATGLLTCSALLVHISGGVIEAHFHFFVVIVLLTVYEDWVPFLLAVVEVVLHHGVMGAVAPDLVFNHPDAIAHPWRWAGIHAGFVAAAGASAVLSWRLNEDVRREKDVALQRARDAEREAQAALAELGRSNRDLEQFASIASHDLREPLRTVTGFLQLLEARAADRLDDEGREFVRHAMAGSRRMQRLIDDLLELARVGQGEPPQDAVDLEQVVRSVTESLSDAIARTGAKIEVAELPWVRGDERQLGQLLQNLLSNALKFSAGPPTVQLGARPDGDTWTVSVVDDGIGIEPRHAERVFRPFQRLHGAERFEGSGIGLAVCRRIIERHGGRIWAEPAPGGGSAFRFSLPAAPAGERPPRAGRQRSYSASIPS